MNGGIPLYEIIFFAMIAAFLIFRLRSVLGRRSGHHQERPPEGEPAAGPAAPSNDNVIALPDQDKRSAEDASPLGAAYRQIRAADPSFDPDAFVQGARIAFEMIVNAFAVGDRDTLRSLTGDEVFRSFDGTIDDREAAGQVLETTLIGIGQANIVDAGADGRVVWVTVRFVSEQVVVLKDGEGGIISGNSNFIDTVTDIWTFSRDAGSDDPNWHLIATDTEN